MQFVHQALTWGFLLVLVPLLIHLINMLRHRRVRWAAMDFLLQAYKKHRKWIWLKQLLLLLMRVAAVALLVAMLAQWVTRGQWLNLFGGRATHHYVLLDDSFSMSDRAGGASAFELALGTIQRIGTQAANEDSLQKFTLIRFSRASRMTELMGEDGDVAELADFNAEVVAPNFDVILEQRRNAFQVTELSVGPVPALAAVRQLVGDSTDENRVIYVVSDFRVNPWESPAEIREHLRELERSPASIQLVRCATAVRQNLAVTDLQPAQETQAAGVPLFVLVTVKNFGPNVARNIQLNVRTTFFDSDTQLVENPAQLTGKVDEMPTVLIEEIEPGQSVTRRVQAFFPKPGRHVVEAILPEDPVAADNRRWCVIDFPESEPVLIIDGSPELRHAYYLASAFRPGGRANTGIQPEIKTPEFLRDATPQMLRDYHAVFLLDVPRLDDRAIENLELYATDGGGVAFFAGPEVDLTFTTNRLYRSGTGLFPLPLESEDFLPREDVREAPDIEVTDHPVFEVFLGERNPLIRLITVEKYLRPPFDWKPEPDSTVQVAASLRNQMPLVVERQFGEGRVMAFLTAVEPGWNNWGNDPSFVVVALKLQSYLAAGRRTFESQPVGTPIVVQLEVDKFRQDLQFIAPGETPEMRTVIEQSAVRAGADSPVMSAAIGRAVIEGHVQTDRSGIYEAWPVTSGGQADVRRFALNVDPEGGDLRLVDSKQLLTALDPVKVEIRAAEEFTYELAGLGGSNRSLILMGLLVMLLIAEQALAYSASYHPTPAKT
jgi:hypothetical protein